MEPKDYIVVKIEGEYATLRDIETKEELFIALALLPAGTDVPDYSDNANHLFPGSDQLQHAKKI